MSLYPQARGRENKETRRAMAQTGQYLYGFIRTGEDRDFGYIGLDCQGEPGRVHTIRVDPVAAVVSTFSKASKVLPLRKNLDPHHKVIREVMKASTIIPMTYGHVANSKQEVDQVLRRNHSDILSELERLDGRIEMGLRVMLDVDNIFEYVVHKDPELAAFRDHIFGRSGPPSHAEKIELGRVFEERLSMERERDTKRVVDGFSSWTNEVRVNPPKNELMVMNLAFLIEREREERFKENVYGTAKMFPREYTFDFNGPWAPFNFVNLDLQLVS